MTTTRFVSLAVLPFLLVACASSDEKKVERLCPQVAILRPLERMEDYGSDTIDPINLVAVASMQKVEGSCSYDDKGVDVSFNLQLVAEKGPRLGGERASFPFSVSLLDPDNKVRAKELMTAEFIFTGDAKVATQQQPMHVFLPLAKDEDASGFRVLTGFQLTEDQVKSMWEVTAPSEK